MDANLLIKLKKVIWLYFVLLIFEGALRKWILPGLASPLLLVREPLAIYLLFYGLKLGSLKGNYYYLVFFWITIISSIATIFVGHGNLMVTIYGARIYILDFPIIFIIGSILNYYDVVKIGRVLVAISIFMTVLMYLQYNSPQSARVNIGVGGEGSAGFAANGAGANVFRPSGTFSFTNGVSTFYSLVSSFIFYFWLKPHLIKKSLLIAGTICLLIAIPISLSRSVFFQVLLTGLFTVIVALRNPKMITYVVFGVLAFLALSPIILKLNFMKVTIANFNGRLQAANSVEGGAQEAIASRVFGGAFDALQSSSAADAFWGKGMGLGTNVAGQLLSGSRTFLVSEGEWGRVIGEQGIIFGFINIAIRLILTVKIAINSFLNIRIGNSLPWLLSASMLMVFIEGQWAQPTVLGFAVLGIGLLLASFKTNA